MSHFSDRHDVMLAVFILLRRGNELLLIRRAGPYMAGKLTLPAGHVERHEPAIMAMVREAKEEVGVDVSPADLRLVHTLHRKIEEGEHEYVDLFFETSRWRGEPWNVEPDKCIEVCWADINNLPKEEMIPYIRDMFERLAAGEPYSDANF